MAKSKSYGGLIVLLVVVAAAAGGSWYYFKGRTEKAPEFITVKVARGDIVQAVTATGDLQPVITVDVGAQVSGQIKEVLVDYNSRVKAGDVLALIDESTPVQRLRQAEADLASAKASNQLILLNLTRTKELFAKKLVSQQELDSISAQLAQSNATLLTREATVANAKLDLERCTIRAPIDGMILDRKTDKGRTVNASMNAPTLFTLVNDLTKMQINAAVAEADVGLVSEGQPVRFTVDAFPGRPFTGTVRMVRNAASANQNVVSYATIIDVANEDLKLKPGMTANVSIIVAERPNVLRVANQALRVRVPQDLQPRQPPAVVAKAEKKGDKGPSASGGGNGSPGAVATMTDDERMRATMDIMREIGFERGAPPSPDQIERAKRLAKEKGLDPDLVAARMAMPGGRTRGSTTGGSSSRGSVGGSRAGGTDRGFNNTVITRTLYKFADPTALEKKLEPVTARLGISDGIHTEVLEGLSEGDTVITAVIMPGAAPVMAGPSSGGMQNPFQSSSSRGSSGMRGPPGR
jgi:HlyD family secretion protein